MKHVLRLTIACSSFFGRQNTQLKSTNLNPLYQPPLNTPLTLVYSVTSLYPPLFLQFYLLFTFLFQKFLFLFIFEISAINDKVHMYNWKYLLLLLSCLLFSHMLLLLITQRLKSVHICELLSRCRQWMKWKKVRGEGKI